MFYNQVLLNINKKIKLTQKELEKILRAVLTTSNFWKIAELCELTLPFLSSVLRSLQEQEIIKIKDDKILLSSKGKKLIQELCITKIQKFTCPYCKTEGVNFNLLNIKKKFLELQKNRPQPLRKYDQGYITPETTLKRVSFAISKGDVTNKEIFIIGDDDLVSIALGLTRLPKRIVVVDIDKRLIDFISKISKKESLNLEVLTLDVREPLPKEFLHKFDTFFTDPSETLEALKMFIGRGLVSLKGVGSAGYFGLTHIEASLDKWHKFEKIILSEFNCVITDIISNFNEYVNWPYATQTRAFKISPVKSIPKNNWYKSSLIRIELLKRVSWNLKVRKKNIYSDKEASTT